MSAQSTPRGIPWADIIAGQMEVIRRCRGFDARAYEVACLAAMKRAWEQHELKRAAASGGAA